MWFFIQIAIFLTFIIIPIFVGRVIYWFLLVVAVIFTFAMVFVNWLLLIQLGTIYLASSIGFRIITFKENCKK